MGDGAAEDETARLKPRDAVDLFSRVRMQHLVDRHAKPARIVEKRRDVPEHDPLMREIRDRADIVADGLRHTDMPLAMLSREALSHGPGRGASVRFSA